ncbi:MFS transporter [Natrialba sp. PRR66]|uniref:MFS transporter n=1 Tax=Natrialba sp. PRR66 TaxID=3098146 RepID=UPI002B1E69B3|nr:MFS transporter [Natrialba sp. PRR66]
MSKKNTNSRLVIGTLLVASTLTIMVDTALSPALPAIQDHFVDVENAAFWIRLVYVFPSLFVAIGAPILGALIDRIGRKPVLGMSTTLYGISGGAGFILNTIPTLLVSRALLGLGAAGVFVAATTLIADYFPDKDRRDTVFGWQSGTSIFGGSLFFLFGGVLASINWRTPFLLYSTALALVPLIAAVLYEPDPGDHHTGHRGDDDSIRQPLRRLPLGKIMLIYLIALIGMIVFFTLPIEIPFYLNHVLGAGNLLVALVLAAEALFSGLISVQYSRLRSRLNVSSIVALMFGLMGAGFVIISLGQTIWGIMGGLFVSGAGIGLLQPNLNAWIASDIPEDVRGRAVGCLTSSIFLGQFLSPFVSSPLSAWLGLRLTFQVGGILMIGLGAVFLLFSWQDWVTSQPANRSPSD